VFREESVKLSGIEPTRYRHVSDESGRWLDMYFCPQCGSNLGFTLQAVPGVRTVPAGTLDDPGLVNPKQMKVRHVFTRSRRTWAELTSDVEAYEHHFRA
jgi:hypothetical protein